MMNRDKQIEEMAENITLYRTRQQTTRWGDVVGESRTYSSEYEIAQDLYKAGYRKSTDLAREIFEEIEAELKRIARNGYVGDMSDIFAELKKKYTEGEKEKC